MSDSKLNGTSLKSYSIEAFKLQLLLKQLQYFDLVWQ